MMFSHRSHRVTPKHGKGEPQMTAIHKIVRAGFAACALLLTSHQTGVAQAAHPCAVKEKLTLALARAQQHQREPHEFDGVAMVAGSFARTPIVDDVVEYAFLLKVGAGDHDVIRLHRVVREKAPCKPRSAHKALFLLHGAPVDFRTSFLPSLLSNQVPRDQAFAVFLAQRNLDVWGLDLRWALVPRATTDFTFMQDWNYATDIHDIALSLALARGVRTLTGSGAGKLHLLGWSNGGMLAYAYANDETRFPRSRRHVKGLIPVDIFFKLSPSDEPLRQDACKRAAVLQSLLEAGTLANDNTIIQLLGSLAATAPDEPSPFAPQFTNRTLALLSRGSDVGGRLSARFPPVRPVLSFSRRPIRSGLPAADRFDLYERGVQL